MLSSREPANNACILLEIKFPAGFLQVEKQDKYQTEGLFKRDNGRVFLEGALKLRWQNLMVIVDSLDRQQTGMAEFERGIG